MRSDLREFLAAAGVLGFQFDGYTGSGHMRLVHPQAGVYITAATPSDYRGVRNSLSDMERLSGVRLPRSNAAHMRFKPRDRAADQLREQRAAAARRAERQKRTQWAVESHRSAAEAFQTAVARRITAADTHRREIEALMRPGRGLC